MFRKAIGGSICYWDSNLILFCFLFCQPSLAETKRGKLVFQAGHHLSGPERFTNVVLSNIWNESYAAENSHLGDILIFVSV